MPGELVVRPGAARAPGAGTLAGEGVTAGHGPLRPITREPTNPSTRSSTPTASSTGTGEPPRSRCQVITTCAGGVAPSTAATSRQRPGACGHVRLALPAPVALSAQTSTPVGSGSEESLPVRELTARSPSTPVTSVRAAPPRYAATSPSRPTPTKTGLAGSGPLTSTRTDGPSSASASAVVTTTGAPAWPTTRTVVTEGLAPMVPKASASRRRTAPVTMTARTPRRAGPNRRTRSRTGGPTLLAGREQRLEPVHLALELPVVTWPDVGLEHQAHPGPVPPDDLDGLTHDAQARLPVALDRGEHRVGPIGQARGAHDRDGGGYRRGHRVGFAGRAGGGTPVGCGTGRGDREGHEHPSRVSRRRGGPVRRLMAGAPGPTSRAGAHPKDGAGGTATEGLMRFRHRARASGSRVGHGTRRSALRIAGPLAGAVLCAAGVVAALEAVVLVGRAPWAREGGAGTIATLALLAGGAVLVVPLAMALAGWRLAERYARALR